MNWPTTNPRFGFLPVCILPAALLLASCSNLSTVSEMPGDALRVSLPARPSQQTYADMLAQIGAMIIACNGKNYYEPVLVDYIANNSGQREGLPNNLTMHVLCCLKYTGVLANARPLHDSITRAQATTGFAVPSPIPAAPYEALISGELMNVFESIRSVRGGSADGRASLNTGEMDATVEADGGTRVRVVKAGLYMEPGPGRPADQIAPFSAYEADAVSNEESLGFTFFVNGTGGGILSRLEITKQDTETAIEAATAGALARLLGYYFLIPYYRAVPELDGDPELDQFYLRTLSLESDRTLKGRAKVMLLANGEPMDLSRGDLSPEDETILRQCMEDAGHHPDERKDLERFVFHLWSGVDYQAKRLQDEIAIKTRGLRTLEEQRLEAQAMAATAPAATAPAATAPASTAPASIPPPPAQNAKAADTIILDLTRVAEALRTEQLNSIQSLPRVQKIDKVQEAGLYRVEFAGAAYDFHTAVKQLKPFAKFDILGNKADWSVATISPRPSQP